MTTTNSLSEPPMTNEVAMQKLFEYQQTQGRKWTTPVVDVEKLIAANRRIEGKLRELSIPLVDYVSSTLSPTNPTP